MQIASLFFYKKKDLHKTQAFKTQNPQKSTNSSNILL